METAAYGGIEGGWRRARITITNSQLFTVQMSRDGGTNWQTIIDQFDLSTAPGQAALPANFKLGFSAGTGTMTHYHRVDNLSVSAPVDIGVAVTQQPGGPFSTGAPVNYQYTVTSNGPNGSNLIEVTENIPAGIENVLWGYTTNSGDSDSGTGGFRLRHRDQGKGSTDLRYQRQSF